jgi:outer membrane immunogenic protein
MRRFQSAALAAVAVVGFASVACAADMPVKAATPPMAPVATPFNWYGFYIGGQIGYDWGHEAINLTPDVNYTAAFLAGNVPYSLAANPRGVLGGIQWGSNWQFGHIVLGTASDFSFSDIKASQTSFATVGPAVVTSVGSQKLTWLSTMRVRAGYTVMDNLLLYGTGGLADGRASASSSVTVTGACGGGGNCPGGSATKTLWGWAAGGGRDYAMGHWSVDVEYLHYDLGHLNYNMTDPTLPGAFIAASTKFSGDNVRGGLNYRFDWTPWELVFGGHH